MESVLCSRCGGRGNIYAGSSFSTCGMCGGQGRVLKARSVAQGRAPRRQKTGANRSAGRASIGSGREILGGIVVIGLAGVALLGYVTEQVLPALSQNWPWVLWYVLLVTVAFSAVIYRARSLERVKFLPEIALAALIAVKFILADFWTSGTQYSPTLSTLFLLSCACVSLLFLLFHRRPWFSHQVYCSSENEVSWPIVATVVTLLVLGVLAVFAAWVSSLSIWDIWSWAKTLILPFGVVIFPYWVAFYLRVILVTKLNLKRHS